MIKKKILIVGGTGFIGFHLSKQLLKLNFIVHSISTKKPTKLNKLKNVKYIILDITKKKNFVKKINFNYEIIINLGGYVDHSNKIKTYLSHYNGCKNLIDFFKEKSLKFFLQIGSSLEYGDTGVPHREDQNCLPKANYAKAKFRAGKYIKKMSKKFKFDYLILRLYQIYGPNQKPNRLLPSSIVHLLKYKKFLCSDGNQLRDFLYVDDLISLFKLILTKNKYPNCVLNVGSGKQFRIISILRKIKKNIGKGQLKIGSLPMRKDETVHNYPNISKVKRTYNWRPKVNLSDGLRKTILFYKKNIFLK